MVDLIRGFTDPQSPLGAEMDEVVERSRQLLDAAREAAVVTVFTTIIFDEAARASSAWVRKVPSLAEFTPTSKAGEIDPRLDRRDHEPIVSKRGASAFFDTSLHTTLAARGVDTVFIIGATTSGCVRASVVDAVQYGFDTFVVMDCVADRAAGPHNSNLFDMTMKYADAVTAAEVIAYLIAPRTGATQTAKQGA